MDTVGGMTLTDTTAPTSKTAALFEPAMCCSTGVCGPSVDQQLIDVREDLRWAENQGLAVSRHNLSSDPDAFVAAPKVAALMQALGDAALPALVVGDEIVVHGRYPTRQELASHLAPPIVELPQAASESRSCGCGPSGC